MFGLVIVAIRSAICVCVCVCVTEGGVVFSLVLLPPLLFFPFEDTTNPLIPPLPTSKPANPILRRSPPRATTEERGGTCFVVSLQAPAPM